MITGCYLGPDAQYLTAVGSAKRATNAFARRLKAARSTSPGPRRGNADRSRRKAPTAVSNRAANSRFSVGSGSSTVSTRRCLDATGDGMPAIRMCFDPNRSGNRTNRSVRSLVTGSIYIFATIQKIEFSKPSFGI